MKLRKLNRILHRDLGFIFFGMTIIYSISGIALNHIDDWNPSYIVKNTEIIVDNTPIKKDLTKSEAKELLLSITTSERYKNHYYPNDNTLKIFVKNGNILINTYSGQGIIETSKRRPIFHQFNYLHYNPQKWWTTFSDIFAIALFLIAVTGLFIIKGKKGITGRGAILTTVGILIPILFLILNYWAAN